MGLVLAQRRDDSTIVGPTLGQRTLLSGQIGGGGGGGGKNGGAYVVTFIEWVPPWDQVAYSILSHYPKQSSTTHAKPPNWLL